jgi:membrane associated rhomboid family serine protease
MTFRELIRDQWRNGGWSIKIIAINLLVFLIINLFINLDRAFLIEDSGFVSFYRALFILPSSFFDILTHPWTIVTHMFAQQDFWHFFFNMLWFYFGSRLFVQFLGDKRLLYVYLFGGLFGALMQVLATNFIPFFVAGGSGGMLGASAAVSAVFIAIAFYKPTFEVMLFGLFPVRIIWIGVIMLLSDFLRVTDLTNVAHVAHLGGAAAGALCISNLARFDRIVARISGFFWIFSGGFSKMRSRIFIRKKVTPEAKHFHKSDEAYFESKKEIQEKIDQILDKIKSRGYDGLTKAEKDYLFSHKDKL